MSLKTSRTHIMSSGPTPSPGTRVTLTLWSRTGSGDEMTLWSGAVTDGGTYRVFEGVYYLQCDMIYRVLDNFV